MWDPARVIVTVRLDHGRRASSPTGWNIINKVATYCSFGLWIALTAALTPPYFRVITVAIVLPILTL
ncbi:hypothetical protein E2C01_064583 [Portunus trituberculatus]|uniref:Uncharacterized protein n=1 Tax=Portunus trituberculatus TaxID=210409 RepID=A0A5B7HKR4_PORTR|nr:hypothetical protein [Portunus trituberculatus]